MIHLERYPYHEPYFIHCYLFIQLRLTDSCTIIKYTSVYRLQSIYGRELRKHTQDRHKNKRRPQTPPGVSTPWVPGDWRQLLLRRIFITQFVETGSLTVPTSVFSVREIVTRIHPSTFWTQTTFLVPMSLKHLHLFMYRNRD